jgi:arylsulfatase A-like enzyme
METKGFCSNVFRAFICVSLMFISGEEAFSQQKRNVLFLMADDFNFWTGASGYHPSSYTPVLDAFADKGVMFTDAHCPSPVCNPSRNAFMSGFRPSTTGITTNGDGYVRDKTGFEDIVTMNQYFTDNGYFTYGAGKIYHPGKMGGRETDPENWTIQNTNPTGCNGGNLYVYDVQAQSNYKWSANPSPMTEQNCNDYALANQVAELLTGYQDSEQSDQPFFIACGVFRPHMPWNSPVEFWNEFNFEEILVPPPGYNGETGSNVHQEIVNAGKWKEAIHAYLASCRLADYNIGIILEALENSPYADNTIVVFMGDHGWHLGEKGHWGKFSTWNEANQTTLIIFDPSANGNGKRSHKVVSLQDIYPTLIELAGLPPKTNIEGRSLAPLLEEPNREDWDWPVLMSYGNTDYIKTNEYRYVKDGSSSRLYDIRTDPYEWVDLYGNSGYNSVVERLNFQIDSMVSIGTALRNKLLSNYVFTYEPLAIPGIIEAENYDEGAPGKTYYDSTPNNGPAMYRLDAVDIAITDDPLGGGFHITEAVKGEWLQYTVGIFVPGLYDIEARFRNNSGVDVPVSVFLDGNQAGSMVVDSSGDKWHYTILEDVLVEVRNGYLIIRIEFGGDNVDMNYFRFVRKETVNNDIVIRDDGRHKLLMSNLVENGHLYLDLTPTNPVARIELYDSMGKKLQEDVVAGELMKAYPISPDLPAGMYMVRISDGNIENTEKFYVR